MNIVRGLAAGMCVAGLLAIAFGLRYAPRPEGWVEIGGAVVAVIVTAYWAGLWAAAGGDS